VSAVFSEDRTLRYELRRSCGLGGGTVMWVMFNPSMADEEVNDPTIRRVIDFEEREASDGTPRHSDNHTTDRRRRLSGEALSRPYAGPTRRLGGRLRDFSDKG
jgi:hypothetical protein